MAETEQLEHEGGEGALLDNDDTNATVKRVVEYVHGVQQEEECEDDRRDRAHGRTIARTSVARAALHLGLTSVSASALEVLVDALLDYQKTMGDSMAAAAEAAGRSSAHSNLLDALYASEATTSPAIQSDRTWEGLASFLFGPDWATSTTTLPHANHHDNSTPSQLQLQLQSPSSPQQTREGGWNAPYPDPPPRAFPVSSQHHHHGSSSVLHKLPMAVAASLHQHYAPAEQACTDAAAQHPHRHRPAASKASNLSHDSDDDDDDDSDDDSDDNEGARLASQAEETAWLDVRRIPDYAWGSPPLLQEQQPSQESLTAAAASTPTTATATTTTLSKKKRARDSNGSPMNANGKKVSFSHQHPKHLHNTPHQEEQVRQQRPSYVPSFLPPFPPERTYHNPSSKHNNNTSIMGGAGGASFTRSVFFEPPAPADESLSSSSERATRRQRLMERQGTSTSSSATTTVRQSLVQLGDDHTVPMQPWGALAVPVGRAAASSAPTIVPLARASGSRVAKILEGSMDSTN
eukprot:scaffold230780_cov50-Attheya_sp.AAC.2